MRQIKFRAWLTKEEVMVQCHTIACENGTHTCYAPKKGVLARLLNGKNFFAVGAGEAELMQFTGLLDKNGKEIYEGDIVKDNFGHWDNEVVEILPHFFHEFIEYGLLSAELEIIGNIYENPELLSPKVHPTT